MRRLLVVVAMVATLLPFGALSNSAVAGTGSPNDCSGSQFDEIRVPLVTWPITLGFAVWDGTPSYQGGSPTVRLCYSTSPAGHSGPDTTGGTIEFREVPWDYYGDTYRLSCNPQSNPSGITTSCYAGWSGITACVGSCAHFSFGYGAALPDTRCCMEPYVDNVTFSFWIPITACYNGCTSLNPTLGPTGALVGYTVPASAPPGTSTGAGIALGDLWYCVNGGCTHLTSGTNAGAGTNVAAGLTAEPVICWQTCVPGGGWVDVGATVAAVQVGGTMIPVNNPTGPINECAHFWEVVLEAVVAGTDYPCTKE